MPVRLLSRSQMSHTWVCVVICSIFAGIASAHFLIPVHFIWKLRHKSDVISMNETRAVQKKNVC